MLEEKRRIYSDIVIELKPSCKIFGLGFLLWGVLFYWTQRGNNLKFLGEGIYIWIKR